MVAALRTCAEVVEKLCCWQNHFDTATAAFTQSLPRGSSTVHHIPAWYKLVPTDKVQFQTCRRD
jgi:hypothetical protein